VELRALPIDATIATMGSWGTGAFDNDDALDILGDVASAVEPHLVSFVHRVRFKYAMHPDRARAAAVLLTALARAGIRWTVPEDATADLMGGAFATFMGFNPGLDPSHREAIERDVADFVAAYADPPVIASPPSTRMVSGALRAIGAEPSAWDWADRYGSDFEAAWHNAREEARFIPQVALAAGLESRLVIAAFADELLREIDGVGQTQLDSRADMLRVLEAIARDGLAPHPEADRLIAFLENDRARQIERARRHRRAMEEHVLTGAPLPDDEEDPLIAPLACTVELIGSCRSAAERRALDPVRAGDLLAMLARGPNRDEAHGASIHAALDPPVRVAIHARRTAPDEVVSMPLGRVNPQKPLA
jgi:hypothetical protein